MAPQGERWQRRIQAAESASRLLDELSVDQTAQIDVFGMCEDLGLWLAFLPMDNLLGAFVPEGVGGVLVTTQRPIPLQRYTAAHEIGHWRLDHGHGLALDGEEHVLGDTPVEREQLGSLFAGIGGFDLGFEAAGWECAWQVEKDARCRSVLERHWPEVPKYGDVRGVTAMPWTLTETEKVRAVAMYDGGLSCGDIGKFYGVTVAPVAEWIGRRLLTAALTHQEETEA